MKAPNKIYVEVCEDGIFAFPEPPFKESVEYIRTDLLQQEQPELPGIEESGIPGKDYIPVEWVDACEKYGKWKIVKQEQPEVDLEEEIKRSLSNATKMNKGEWRGKYPISDIGFRATARHFYELGLNARKDALLEWAKEKASDYKGTANIRRSFELMIRKIESL